MVLIVDDETMILAVTQAMLEALGFKVLTATDGPTAIKTYQLHKEKISCVLLDLTMPEMNGLETFRALKEIKSEARVIIASGLAGDQAKESFKDTPPFCFIEKPYRLAQLAATLKKVAL